MWKCRNEEKKNCFSPLFRVRFFFSFFFLFQNTSYINIFIGVVDDVQHNIGKIVAFCYDTFRIEFAQRHFAFCQLFNLFEKMNFGLSCSRFLFLLFFASNVFFSFFFLVGVTTMTSQTITNFGFFFSYFSYFSYFSVLFSSFKATERKEFIYK